MRSTNRPADHSIPVPHLAETGKAPALLGRPGPTEPAKAPADLGDGWRQVSKRRPARPDIRPPAPGPPTRLQQTQKRTSFLDPSRFLTELPRSARGARWLPVAEAVHERKHGAATIAIGQKLCRAAVDAKHPAFEDRRSKDIYRFDVDRLYMAVMTSQGEIKTCYPKGEGEFRRAALVAATHRHTALTYEELGTRPSRRQRLQPTMAQRTYTLRDDVLDEALDAGLSL